MQEQRNAPELEQWEEESRRLGRQAAENAASWIGPVECRAARELLGRIADGDPRADEYLPARPDLSGEWADERTPLSLAREVIGDERLGVTRLRDELVDALAEAFEEGVGEAFEDACVAEIRKWAEGGEAS